MTFSLLKRLPDGGDRREAILTDQHAFVWASAGTGKTHTLTLRALYLLFSAPFEAGSSSPMRLLYAQSDRGDRLRAARAVVHSIIMTTFTRKAAAEMKTRLYRYLDSVASAGSLDVLRAAYPDDELFLDLIQRILEILSRPRGTALMPLLDRADGFERLRAGAQALAEVATELQISTIHSLAASILHRHPLEAGIPPTARYAEVDEDDLAGIEEQVVERWWHQVLAQPELQQQLSEILRVVPVGHLRQWLQKIYFNPWIADELPGIPMASQAEVDELKTAGRALVHALSAGGGSRIEANRDRLAEILDCIDSGEGAAWGKLCSFLPEARSVFFLDAKISKTVERALEELPEESSRYFRTLDHFRVPATRAYVAFEFRETWETWTRFVQRFRDWAARAVIRELGLVTFDDMIRLAVRLLEEHPQIRRAERKRLRALLVDEFQDTDSDQLRLLRALLDREGHSQQGPLGFFVGDSKQSIYRFRGADVPSVLDFFQKYEEYAGTRPGRREFTLTSSFRSLPPVTRFVNHFFETEIAFTRAEEGLEPVRTEEGELPRWIFIDADPDGRDFIAGKGREFLAVETLKLIREYVDRADPADPPYKDVLVLVHNRWEIDALVPLLQEASIPVVSSGAKTFYRHPEVLDVLNLLIALFHPQDELAVAAVLRSPMIELSDPEIHELLEGGSPALMFHSTRDLPEAMASEAQERIHELRRLAAARAERTFSEWIQDVRAFIPVAMYSLAGDREGRPLVRIERILETFQQQVEMAVMPPLLWLLDQRERAGRSDRWDADLGEDVTVADESVNAVRVMTVHKTKGLQGRFVIVYGWTSILENFRGLEGSFKRPQIIRLTTEDGRSLRAFTLKWGEVEVFSSTYPDAVEREQSAAREEARRLAYVAATRAQDRVVFLCSQSKGSRFSEEIDGFIQKAKAELKGEGSAIVCGGILNFTHGAGRPADPTPPPAVSSRWSSSAYEQLWRRRHADRQKPPTALLRHPTDPEHQQEEIVEESHVRRKHDRDAGALIGRLVHLYLERFLLDQEFEDAKLSSLSSVFPEALQNPTAVYLAGRHLERFYTGALLDEAGRPYRERVRQGHVLGREVPVFMQEEEQIWHGIIDLILEEAGSVRAVDYKTAARKDPLPDLYAQQRRIYTQALKELFPNRRVEFEFWWMG